MTVSQTIPLGRQELLHVVAETTFGTHVFPSATDAVRIKSMSLGFQQDRQDRSDKLSSRGKREKVTFMKHGDFTITTLLLPSGSAGTAPDAQDLFESALGVETVNGGVSVVYSPKTTLTQPQSLSFYQQLGHMARGYMGCVVDKMKITLDKKAESEVEFSGWITDSFHCGTDEVEGTVASGNSSFDVLAGQGEKFSVGAHFKQGSDTQDYVITAINNDTLTFTPNLAAEATDENAVIPTAVAATTAGAPISGILGSFTIGGSTVYITKAVISVENNNTPREEIFGSAVHTGIKQGDRMVNVEFELFLQTDYLIEYGHAKNFQTRAIVLTSGTTAGSICTITMNQVEFTIPQIEGGGIEEVLVTVQGQALMSTDTANDEIDVTFT